MNIVNTLTLRHLKENKKRTLITVIGIIISVAMITATCVSVTSLMHLFAQDELYRHGNSQVQVDSVTAKQIATLEQDETVQYVSAYKSATDLGSEGAVHVESGKKNAVCVGDVLAGNLDWYSVIFTADYTGAFPKNETEILVTRAFLENNELDWKIGDTVTLELGARVVQGDDGEALPIYGGYTFGETFRKSGEKTFTVVGIAEQNNEPTYYTQVFRGFAPDEADGASLSLAAPQLNRDTQEVLYTALEKAGIAKQDAHFNADLFRYNFLVLQGESKDVAMATMLAFGAIILVIIVIASVMLIYNAFGISIAERARYLGMLASVGATKAQKRRSVYFEGAVLGLIGIPLGFAAGICGMAVTFRLLQPLLAQSGLNVAQSGLSLTLFFPWWIVPAVAVMSIVTIAVSAYIPARRASRTTPIDALRQNTDVKVKSKKLRSPKIVRALFGYEGELAYKNMKRNGKKSRVITSSLALSVVLFLSVYSFCDMFSETNKMSGDVPYQVYAFVQSADAPRFTEAVSELDNIRDVYSVNTLLFKNLSTDAGNYKNGYDRIFKAKDGGKGGFTLLINVLDDADFDALCKENGMASAPFYDGKTVLVMNCLDRTEQAAKVFADSVVGTEFTALGDSECPYTVGGLVNYRNTGYYYQLSSPGLVGAFVPYSAVPQEKMPIFTLGFVTDDHAALAEDISNILENGAFRDCGVNDIIGNMAIMQATVQIMEVFVYGFITLMTLISVANIFNTVSTSIDLRRKEFAMLKSVGVTPKGFNRMLRFESLFYGLKALVYGLPLGTLAAFAMQQTLMAGDFKIAFHLNGWVYFGVTAAVFCIVGLSMLYSTAKVKKDSIIETLKSEIN